MLRICCIVLIFCIQRLCFPSNLILGYHFVSKFSHTHYTRSPLVSSITRVILQVSSITGTIQFFPSTLTLVVSTLFTLTMFNFHLYICHSFECMSTWSQVGFDHLLHTSPAKNSFITQSQKTTIIAHKKTVKYKPTDRASVPMSPQGPLAVFTNAKVPVRTMHLKHVPRDIGHSPGLHSQGA